MWWTCFYLCHLTNILRYSSWFILYYKGNVVQSIRVISFLGKTTFCANGHAYLLVMLCHLEWYVGYLPFSISFISFFFTFFLPTWHQVWRLPQLQQSPVPLWFPLPNMVVTTDANLSIGLFFFRVLGMMYPVVEPCHCLFRMFILLCKKYKCCVNAV